MNIEKLYEDNFLQKFSFNKDHLDINRINIVKDILVNNKINEFKKLMYLMLDNNDYLNILYIDFIINDYEDEDGEYRIYINRKDRRKKHGKFLKIFNKLTKIKTINKTLEFSFFAIETYNINYIFLKREDTDYEILLKNKQDKLDIKSNLPDIIKSQPNIGYDTIELSNILLKGFYKDKNYINFLYYFLKNIIMYHPRLINNFFLNLTVFIKNSENLNIFNKVYVYDAILANIHNYLTILLYLIKEITLSDNILNIIIKDSLCILDVFIDDKDFYILSLLLENDFIINVSKIYNTIEYEKLLKEKVMFNKLKNNI